MNKGTKRRRDRAPRAACWATPDIRVGFFLQLGYLGEELDDILATRRLVEEARPDDVGVSVSYPLPGTKFYELVKAAAGRQDALAGEQRSGNDVRRHVHLGVLPRRAQPAARPGEPRRRRPRACAKRWNELVRRDEPRLPPVARRAGRECRLCCVPAAALSTRLMADILLTHGYFLAEDEKERQIMKPYPPLGLLYLSAFLKRVGFSRRGVRQHLRRARGAARSGSRPRPAAWSASTPTS